MKHRLTNHAKQQMRRRGIEPAQVAHALENQVSTWEDGANQSVVVKGTDADGTVIAIAVVGHLPLTPPLIVKTVY